MAQKLEPTRRLKKPDGTIVYVWNGKLHNSDDAAVIHPDGKKEWWLDRKSTRLNSSHVSESRMPSSA